MVGKAKSMTTLKKLAKETRMSAREIIGESIANVSNAVLATIAPRKQLAQMVNRARFDKNAPKNPKTLSELHFGPQHSKTESGKDFILWDSYGEEEDDPDRIIMFGTQDNVMFLLQCLHWLMDGTFGVAPKLFTQLYTIHGKNFILFSLSPPFIVSKLKKIS